MTKLYIKICFLILLTPIASCIPVSYQSKNWIYADTEYALAKDIFSNNYCFIKANEIEPEKLKYFVGDEIVVRDGGYFYKDGTKTTLENSIDYNQVRSKIWCGSKNRTNVSFVDKYTGLMLINTDYLIEDLRYTEITDSIRKHLQNIGMSSGPAHQEQQLNRELISFYLGIESEYLNKNLIGLAFRIQKEQNFAELSSFHIDFNNSIVFGNKIIAKYDVFRNNGRENHLFNTISCEESKNSEKSYTYIENLPEKDFRFDLYGVIENIESLRSKVVDKEYIVKIPDCFIKDGDFEKFKRSESSAKKDIVGTSADVNRTELPPSERTLVTVPNQADFSFVLSRMLPSVPTGKLSPLKIKGFSSFLVTKDLN